MIRTRYLGEHGGRRIMGGENRELVQLLAVSYIVARQRSGWQRFSEISSNAISLIEVLYIPYEPKSYLLTLYFSTLCFV